MGVKDLWSILDDVGEPCQLADLRGKTLAVDLSGWIVQSESTQYKIAKPHLKALFWRVSALVRNGIRPVFVVDGQLCPALKQSTLDKRQAQRDKQSNAAMPDRGGTFQSPTRTGSSSQRVTIQSPKGATGTSVLSVVRNSAVFQKSVNECISLLKVLGIPYLISDGEAEATCAMLNQTKIVDGVITEDSDTFVFGAQKVYRHFTCDDKTGKVGSGQQEQVESYSMDDIQDKLHLDSNKLLALACLLGCDYYEGVNKVGKEKAMQFLKHYDGDALQRIREWKDDPTKFDDLAKSLPKKKPHCANCGHPGSLPKHKQSGCSDCGGGGKSCLTASKDQPVICHCDWHSNKGYRSLEAELRIRQLALKQEQFPPQQVIDIFRHQPSAADALQPADITWKQPDFDKLKDILQQELYFTAERAQKHVLPVITAYVTANWKQQQPPINSGLPQPKKIIRKRQRNFQPKYEVEWQNPDGSACCDNTMEDVVAFAQRYPALVEAFDKEVMLQQSEKKGKGKKRPLEVDSSQKKINEMFKTKKSASDTPAKMLKLTSRPERPLLSSEESEHSCSQFGNTSKISPSFVEESLSVESSQQYNGSVETPQCVNSNCNNSNSPSVKLEDGASSWQPVIGDVVSARDEAYCTPPDDAAAALLKSPHLLVPSDPTLTSRRHRHRRHSSASSRRSSWSSSTSRSRSPRKTPEQKTSSRSSSRTSTPSRGSGSRTKTPIRDRPYFPKEFAKKLIRVEKRQKFRPRINKDAVASGSGTVTCRKRLFTEPSGIRKRLVFGHGDSDMLSAGIEVDFAPLESDDEGQPRDLAAFEKVLDRRKNRASSPIATAAFYGSPSRSRSSSQATSRSSSPLKTSSVVDVIDIDITPKKLSRKASATVSKAPDSNEVIVIDESPVKILRRSPRKVQVSPQDVFADDINGTASYSTPVKTSTPQIAPSKSRRLDSHPGTSSSQLSSRPSASTAKKTASAASTAKQTSVSKGGMKKKSRRRLRMDDSTPSVKKFLTPLR